ncbi:hypothetical protein BG015_000121, partial [Linnemannia schmuckeri]
EFHNTKDVYLMDICPANQASSHSTADFIGIISSLSEVSVDSSLSLSPALTYQDQTMDLEFSRHPRPNIVTTVGDDEGGKVCSDLIKHLVWILDPLEENSVYQLAPCLLRHLASSKQDHLTRPHRHRLALALVFKPIALEVAGSARQRHTFPLCCSITYRSVENQYEDGMLSKALKRRQTKIKEQEQRSDPGVI